MLAPGALHHDFVVAKAAAERAAARNVDRQRALIRPGLDQIALDRDQVPARAEPVQVLDERALQVDQRPPGILPGQPTYRSVVGRFLARQHAAPGTTLALVHEVDVVFF